MEENMIGKLDQKVGSVVVRRMDRGGGRWFPGFQHGLPLSAVAAFVYQQNRQSISNKKLYHHHSYSLESRCAKEK
jgi:hypothetical protein